MMIAFIIVCALIAANALYVAAEFAAVSARRTRIRQLANAGNPRARWIRGLHDHPAALDRYVACCQVGITLTSLVLGAYGQTAFTPPLAGMIEDVAGFTAASALAMAAVVVLVVLTALQVVLGELIPKSVALQFAVQVALYTALPMRWSLTVLGPLITVLNGSGLGILRLIGASTTGHQHIHSPEEISLLIADSRAGGLLSVDEQERLDRALRLSVLPVRRLMIPRQEMIGVEADTSLPDMLTDLTDRPLTRLPVYRRTLDDIIGVVHTRDVAKHVLDDMTRRLRVRDVMRPVAFVPESIRADQLVEELRRQRSEQAIVTDEHGSIVGLVTLDDLLAEVLGESGRDEADREPERLPDGRLRLPGRMRVDEAQEWLGVLWECDSDTVGGAVTEYFGRFPQAGDRIVISGVHVEVEAAAGHSVTTVIVRPVDPLAEVQQSA